MGTIFRKQFTKPLPEAAELFTRKGEHFARWIDGNGKTRTEKVTTGKDGTPKFRDGGRVVREVATGCHDETAARQVLADLLKRAEHVKAGLTTAAQDAVIDQQNVPLSAHVDAFIAHLTAKGTTAKHRKGTRAYLDGITRDCSFTKLADIERGALEQWLVGRAAAGVSARTRNVARAALLAFSNWCVTT
ncbi:MAG: site-specific integrase, partial [Planctomycetota bacterium]|nr:site-specific integrase [Planctomycetota bacterium]